jgi:hypothetical protein
MTLALFACSLPQRRRRRRRRRRQLLEYADRLDAVNTSANALGGCAVNSGYFVPWLTTVIVGAYIWHGGGQVVRFDEGDNGEGRGEGGLELAQFLSTIGIMRAVGSEFTVAYSLVLRLTTAYASIAEVTVFLNMPVDGKGVLVCALRNYCLEGSCIIMLMMPTLTLTFHPILLMMTLPRLTPAAAARVSAPAPRRDTAAAGAGEGTAADAPTAAAGGRSRAAELP